jgi:Do/DeqQ family serine protease
MHATRCPELAHPRRFLTPAALCLLLALAPSPLDQAQAAFPEPALATVAPVLREVTPAVVNIATRTRVEIDNPLLRDPVFRRFYGIPDEALRRETRSSGSGVIVDAGEGLVLTNAHVVGGADLIEVTTKDNRRFRATLVGHDDATDIAVLKLPAERLSALPLGDSDRLQVGDFVLAIGNPFGLGQTVTSGIVSALGRAGLGIEGYEDFIQTDASINPGNSGGTLVTLDGRLVGINTAILAPTGGNIGIGFAVPINMAKRVMEQLVRYGEVRRGRIGVAIQDLTPELVAALGVAASEGAVISDVDPRSSAARAGLARGDVVVAADGVPIRSSAQLRNVIGLTRAGASVELTFDRGGRRSSVRVRVEPAPS